MERLRRRGYDLVAPVRLLADDLTGALDAGARLVGRSGPLSVTWQAGQPGLSNLAAGSLAIDLGTRETTEQVAVIRTTQAAAALGGAGIAFLKIDSLLRGHVAAQIAACLRVGVADDCVIAPAFPAQARMTRDGRQWARPADTAEWLQVGPDLRTALAAHGIAVTLRRRGDAAPPGVSLWDAATDADLAHTVEAGRARGSRLLWCGTAGLAGALSWPTPAVPPPDGPLLALIGTDHPVTALQVAEIGAFHRWIEPVAPGQFAPVGALLTNERALALSIRIPSGEPRAAAAARIASAFGAALLGLQKPATLFVTGGETLRAVCTALTATHLTVLGEIAPGLPVSRMDDGRWAGVTVVSKSGAFGDPGLILRLISAARC